MRFLALSTSLAFLFLSVRAGCSAEPPGSSGLGPNPKKSDEALPQLKRLSATLQSPLFVDAPDGTQSVVNVRVTGKASPLNPGAPGEVLFSPPLSAPGRAVLQSVSEYLLEVHCGWPSGHRIEFSFSAPVAADDAAAAGLAVATLLDSMLGGWETDPTVAHLGKLERDGGIQKVSKAMARMTAAARGGASRVLIAEANSAEAADCLVNEGVIGFSRVQILAVKDFEELRMMAAKKLDPGVAAALQRFHDVQRGFVGNAQDEERALAQSDVQDALRGTLAKWPNHVTARLLLGRGVGRYRTFSIAGSVEAIERIAPVLLKAINSAEPHDPSKLRANQINAEMMTLQRASERIDGAARPFFEQVTAYADAASAWHKLGPARTVKETRTLTVALVNASTRARQERQKLATLLTR
jgi:hypothetical protein